MVRIKCGWCGKEFNAEVFVGKSGDRSLLKCPHCAHLLSSSRKLSTGSMVGRQHVHLDWEDGDTAI